MTTFLLLVRLIVSLGIVFGLMSVCARLARRSGLGGVAGGKKGLPIEVVARHGLGKRASLAIVRTGGRELVVGITDHTVTLLTETTTPLLVDLTSPSATAPTNTPELAPRMGTAPIAPWKALVTRAQEATVRR